jgi:homoserine dehydrogenase
LRITLLGFGTVGIGLAEALIDEKRFLSSRGLKFELVAVSDSRSTAVDNRGLDPRSLIQRKMSTGMVGDQPSRGVNLIRDLDSDVIIELTPGNPKDGEPALTHIREALRSSKDVVTANKMPLALHYSELMDEATRKGAMLCYSACVGGGTPMLETGRACGEAEEIEGFDAVLNATSNFVLTRMQTDGMDYMTALAEAKRLGYAEADPSLDVEGFDAAAKLVILANHVMGKRLSLGDVRPLRGISEVGLDDVREAARRGRSIRPLATMHATAEVGPKEVEDRDPLNVFGATNVVVFRCSDSGDRVVSGHSGGGVATSRAVLRDLVSIANQSKK